MSQLTHGREMKMALAACLTARLPNEESCLVQLKDTLVELNQVIYVEPVRVQYIIIMVREGVISRHAMDDH